MVLDRTDLAVISATLTAVCVIPYLRDVFRGTTRPQRMSWFTFAAFSVVAAVSQLLAGADAGSWLAAGSAVGFTAVFIVSIRRGVGGRSPADVGALALTVAGVIVALVIERPLVAIGAVVVAELAAVGLTIRKALLDPSSETPSTWALDCLAGGVAIVAVEQVSFVNLVYPVHHTLANAAVLGAIAVGRRRGRRRAAPAGR